MTTNNTNLCNLCETLYTICHLYQEGSTINDLTNEVTALVATMNEGSAKRWLTDWTRSEGRSEVERYRTLAAFTAGINAAKEF